MADDIYDYFGGISPKKVEPIEDDDLDSLDESDSGDQIAEPLASDNPPAKLALVPETIVAQEPKAEKSASHWDFLAGMLGIKSTNKEAPATASPKSSVAPASTPSSVTPPTQHSVLPTNVAPTSNPVSPKQSEPVVEAKAQSRTSGGDFEFPAEIPDIGWNVEPSSTAKTPAATSRTSSPVTASKATPASPPPAPEKPASAKTDFFGFDPIPNPEDSTPLATMFQPSSPPRSSILDDDTEIGSPSIVTGNLTEDGEEFLEFEIEELDESPYRDGEEEKVGRRRRRPEGSRTDSRNDSIIDLRDTGKVPSDGSRDRNQSRERDRNQNREGIQNRERDQSRDRDQNRDRDRDYSRDRGRAHVEIEVEDVDALEISADHSPAPHQSQPDAENADSAPRRKSRRRRGRGRGRNQSEENKTSEVRQDLEPSNDRDDSADEIGWSTPPSNKDLKPATPRSDARASTPPRRSDQRDDQRSDQRYEKNKDRNKDPRSEQISSSEGSRRRPPSNQDDTIDVEFDWELDDDASDLDLESDSESPRSKSRRTRRRRGKSGRSREETQSVGNNSDDQHDDIEDDDDVSSQFDNDQYDEIHRRPSRSGSTQAPPRSGSKNRLADDEEDDDDAAAVTSFPTWAEAVAVMVDANIKNHSGSGNRGRGRGGSRNNSRGRSR